MKIKSFIYTALASALLLTSCESLNEEKEFNDGTQAFIAFDGKDGRWDCEMKEGIEGAPDELRLTLYCASVAGINAEVSVVTSSAAYTTPAIEGQHYVIDRVEMFSVDYDQSSPTFNQPIDVKVVEDYNGVIKFTAEHRFAAIYIKSIDNSEQDGDKKFDIELTDVKGCILGADKKFTITVSDDEDPLNQLVGSYTATAISMFDGTTVVTWSVSITRDEEDGSMFWINPACTISGASSYNSVYAVADLDNATLSMPYGQTLYGSPESASYNLCIAGFDSDYNPVLNGVNVANLEFTEEGGVTIRWTGGLGVGNLVDNSWWWQAVGDVTYVKQ